ILKWGVALERAGEHQQQRQQREVPDERDRQRDPGGAPAHSSISLTNVSFSSSAVVATSRISAGSGKMAPFDISSNGGAPGGGAIPGTGAYIQPRTIASWPSFSSICRHSFSAASRCF